MSDKPNPLQQVSGELPRSRAVRLEELAGYATGSVVSRTLLKKGGGSITLFAFDAGQGLSEHSTPYDAVVQILDGAAVLTIGGEAVPAAAGETVLMPADIPHAVHAPQRFKMLLTMLR
jgi:quercetin dioxygenase-like cupin family protein